MATATPSGLVDVTANGETLSLDQAGVLASALHANFQTLGAEFTLTIPVDGAELRATGEVDWARHEGHLRFDAGSAAAAGLGEAYWNALDVVLPTVGPGGGPATEWTSRPADLTLPLDRAMAIVTALAAQAQDNPVLLQQSDARWLGQEERDGERLTVYKRAGLVLWIGPDGLVRRAQGYLADLADYITIEFHEYGPQTIAMPAS